MMEQKRTGRIACILELIVETICFLCISYLLGCATYSFWNHPLFILFFFSQLYSCCGWLQGVGV